MQLLKQNNEIISQQSQMQWNNISAFVNPTIPTDKVTLPQLVETSLCLLKRSVTASRANLERVQETYSSTENLLHIVTSANMKPYFALVNATKA